MQTVYTARVEILTGPLRLNRTFAFATVRERDAFLAMAAGSECPAVVKGTGIDHLMTAEDALRECRREQQSIG